MKKLFVAVFSMLAFVSASAPLGEIALTNNVYTADEIDRIVTFVNGVEPVPTNTESFVPKDGRVYVKESVSDATNKVYSLMYKVPGGDFLDVADPRALRRGEGLVDDLVANDYTFRDTIGTATLGTLRQWATNAIENTMRIDDGVPTFGQDGFLLRSQENGTFWRVTISNEGTFVFTQVQ